MPLLTKPKKVRSVPAVLEETCWRACQTLNPKQTLKPKPPKKTQNVGVIGVYRRFVLPKETSPRCLAGNSLSKRLL